MFYRKWLEGFAEEIQDPEIQEAFKEGIRNIQFSIHRDIEACAGCEIFAEFRGTPLEGLANQFTTSGYLDFIEPADLKSQEN